MTDHQDPTPSPEIKDLKLFSGTANRPLAEAVAQHLGIRLSSSTVTHLPDGEIHVQINELVRHQDIFLIQPCASPVNDNLMELILLIDAFRRASARYINLVIPYFPYARQDRMAHGREAISARAQSSGTSLAKAAMALFGAQGTQTARLASTAS